MEERQREQLFDRLLAELPALVRDENRLNAVIDCLLADDARCLPFLPELARRLLAFGYRYRPESLDEDPILNPQVQDSIDPECRHEGLSLARAVGAIEQERSDLLAVVVGRHLDAPVEDANALDVRWRWIQPLLKESTAQCLLTAGLAAAPDRCVAKLWRHLLRIYEYASREPDWPSGGPLSACCALGLILTQPDAPDWIRDLFDRTTFWEGWKNEDEWPTRHPCADLPSLKARLTERACLLLGIADRKFWPLRYLRELVGSDRFWPPLEWFCVSDALTGSGSERRAVSGENKR